MMMMTNRSLADTHAVARVVSVVHGGLEQRGPENDNDDDSYNGINSCS